LDNALVRVGAPCRVPSRCELRSPGLFDRLSVRGRAAHRRPSVSAFGPSSPPLRPCCVARRPTSHRMATSAGSGCQPPRSWDHLTEVSATVMGPPFRQLWDHPWIHQCRPV